MGGLTVGVVGRPSGLSAGPGVFSRRNPVLFKLGLRNIPRRRAQTVLIIIGLMLSTAIITSRRAGRYRQLPDPKRRPWMRWAPRHRR